MVAEARRVSTPQPFHPSQYTARLHALVIAGSSGYGNYRHQADAAHAYHVLRAHGVPSDNIILMSTDDAANAKYSPFPGQLFNAPPPSPDVRAGAPVDYSGDDVNAATFLAVLLGDAAGAATHGPQLHAPRAHVGRTIQPLRLLRRPRRPRPAGHAVRPSAVCAGSRGRAGQHDGAPRSGARGQWLLDRGAPVAGAARHSRPQAPPRWCCGPRHRHVWRSGRVH